MAAKTDALKWLEEQKALLEKDPPAPSPEETASAKLQEALQASKPKKDEWKRKRSWQGQTKIIEDTLRAERQQRRQELAHSVEPIPNTFDPSKESTYFKLPNGNIRAYNNEFPSGTTPLSIELFAFQHGLTEDQGGRGRFNHFKTIVDAIWNRPHSPRKFIWSPWAEAMLEEACENQYLSVAGAASCGKSDSFALWAVVQYLCNPANTLVLVTSTTLREARRRVWKSIVEFWTAAPGMPGKLVDSLGQVRGVTMRGELTDATGIVLVPAEKSRERDAIGKLVGIKQRRVILIADELPELPESLVHAAYMNLATNTYFQMIGLGNPASHFDAFGKFSKPKRGWHTVSERDTEWETSRGRLIRFDAEQCPNVVQRRIVYPWMPTYEKVQQAKDDYGEKSALYYRMYRGFWAPVGLESAIYSEADLILAMDPDRSPAFKGDTIKVAGLDPSFSFGGDRTIAYFGEVGRDVNGTPLLRLTGYETLKENINDKTNPRTHQISQQFADACIRRKIDPYYAGIDASGAGGPFIDVVEVMWSRDVLRVQFGGKASDRRSSATDATLSKDRYFNRATEIWFAGKELLRSKQLFGVTEELAQELCSRQYLQSKTTTARKVKIESKQEYRDRVGKSPDLADAFFVLLEVARTRCGLLGGERFEVNKEKLDNWSRVMRKWDVVAASERFLVPD